VRIEGTFDGEIAVKGLLVVGESGKVNCPNLRANTVIVAGAVRWPGKELRGAVCCASMTQL